ncbi:MAG: glycosyltransferase family 2 protein [Candidatus Levyibacteriota bacterium]
MKLDELSIFFPFWNEEKNIEKVVTSAIPVAHQFAKKWEIIMVDDGSKDKTKKVAEGLLEKHKNLRLVSHTPNRGYGSALREGFQAAKYDTVVFADGDGQFDFSEVGKFAAEINSCDIVIGFRKKRRDQKIFKRLLLMNLLKIWDFALFHFYFKDIDCGFKMFKKSALEVISPLRSEGAMITTEILAKATKRKLQIKQVGVEHYPRKYGEQTGANIPVIIRAVLESFILWWDIKNSRF